MLVLPCFGGQVGQARVSGICSLLHHVLVDEFFGFVFVGIIVHALAATVLWPGTDPPSATALVPTSLVTPLAVAEAVVAAVEEACPAFLASHTCWQLSANSLGVFFLSHPVHLRCFFEIHAMNCFS